MSFGLLILLFLFSFSNGSPCAARSYGTYQIVCVCNTTYCDDIEPIGTIASGQAVLYQSSMAGKRFLRTTMTSSSSPTSKTTLQINWKKLYQTIKGFGAAFTDAAGVNMMSLPSAMRDNILRQYWGTDGIGYTIGRVPIASCDFSTHEYSYDDVNGDMAMDNFALAYEDFNYKIPFIKKAMQLSNQQLKLFASPWSAPGWMKTNNDMKGSGLLDGPIDGPYYESYATYLVKFFNEYFANGVSFWAYTAQNEPTTGRKKNFLWQTLFFNASMQRDWIKTILGPKMAANAVTKNVQLMIMDDQRVNLPGWPSIVLSDPAAAEFVSGIALHWYLDMKVPPEVIEETHNLWPNHYIFATEACTGYAAGEGSPVLGDWQRGELYAHDIITDLNRWVTGWTDWNYCLDLQGGPNWVGNYVDAPIIVNASAQEYYKQPMYYALGHFSKFLPPGTYKVEGQMANFPMGVEQVVFVDPQGRRGAVILNLLERDLEVSVGDTVTANKWFNIQMDAKSIVTILFP